MKSFSYGVKVKTMSQYSKAKKRKHKEDKIDKRCFTCEKVCKGTCKEIENK